MVDDPDEFVQEYAAEKLKDIFEEGCTPPVKRIKPCEEDGEDELSNLLGDIILSLGTIHKKEAIISDFTDGEDDDQDFADCY